MAKFNFVGFAKAKLKIKVALIGNEAIQNQMHFKNFYKDNFVSSKTVDEARTWDKSRDKEGVC